MKNIFLCVMLTVTVFKANAQSQQTIRITGTRFTFPVFKKWISEYNKLHPEIQIILSSGIPADSTDILIASHILRPGDVKDGQTNISVARYAQLPVVNSERKNLQQLSQKGFTEDTFKKIYFKDAGYDSTVPANAFIVYKRQKASCSSIAFANHFGNEFKDIKGINVTGDDQDLLEAVKRDTNAVSYNNLGLIYNLKTRKVNDSIAIIPIDLNENGKIDADEKIYSTVDNVVAFVERTNTSKIPVDNINVIFSKTNNNKAVTGFLQWIITSGRQYNHQYGLLTLEPASSKKDSQQLLTAVK